MSPPKEDKKHLYIFSPSYYEVIKYFLVKKLQLETFKSDNKG